MFVFEVKQINAPQKKTMANEQLYEDIFKMATKNGTNTNPDLANFRTAAKDIYAKILTSGTNLVQDPDRSISSMISENVSKYLKITAVGPREKWVDLIHDRINAGIGDAKKKPDVMIETKPAEQPIAQAMGNKARKVAQEPDIDTLIARKQEQDAAIRKKLGPVFK